MWTAVRAVVGMSYPDTSAVTDFSSKAGPSGASNKPEPRKISKSMKPASPPKPKKAPPKRLMDSSDDEMYDSKYAEILSDEDDDATGDQSMFVDDDD
ncbi:hypothetical protein B0H14DRAFT_3895119 [Mycena olivaceomarginata]|nr:hypothetical protein B0H14DRAFT_3895119 [Mycena olivaceomarginata]